MSTFTLITERLLERTLYSHRKAAHDFGGPLIVSISPEEIYHTYAERRHRKTSRNKLLFNAQFVRLFYHGNWDKHLVPFENGDPYKNIKDLYMHRDDYTQSNRFNVLVQALQAGKPHFKKGYDLSSMQGIHAYCGGYVKMFDSMESEGYKLDAGQDTCKIAITSRGEIVKWSHNGFNRLAAAKILNIETIHVEVVRIHPEWMHQFGGAKPKNLRTAIASVESRRLSEKARFGTDT